MKKIQKLPLAVISLILTIPFSISYAQTPPASQTGGGQLQQIKQIEAGQTIEKTITTEKASEGEEITPDIIPEDEGEKVLINKILVEGATLLSQPEIDKVISQFLGTELSLKGMQRVADLLTDEYRKKGYATSRVYIPPQTMKENTLILRVVEGKMGSYEIRGNKYFKTALLEKKLNLKQGAYFDYGQLQKSLTYINEHPDRNAKAVLVPGKEPGTTDLVIEVKDRLPVHIGFEYDNFGSRYVETNRWSKVFEHNNLLGFDDKAYFKMQRSEDTLSRLKHGRYSFPVNPTLDVGMYIVNTTTKLGKEYINLSSRSYAFVVGVFANKMLYSDDVLDVRFNLGYDYKNIENYLLDAISSTDNVRVLKGGLDVDFNDKWARNILTMEIDTGLPEVMGGMHAKSDSSSRGGAGAGGRFVKLYGNYYRLQPFYLDTNLLFKNTFQFSNYDLVASEQFQIGGPASVRGYSPAEFSGDKGAYSSVEWSMPVYLLGKKTKVPFTKNTSFYDSLKFVTFYDWGTTHVNTVLAGEKKYRNLSGWGVGVRFNPNENISLRVEFGYPLNEYNPSDDKNVRPWVEVITKF